MIILAGFGVCMFLCEYGAIWRTKKNKYETIEWLDSYNANRWILLNQKGSIQYAGEQEE